MAAYDSANRLEKGDPVSPSHTEHTTITESSLEKGKDLDHVNNPEQSRSPIIVRFYRWFRQRWIVGVPSGMHRHGRMAPTITRKHHPTGYPRVACFLDSDDAFMVYRRFGYLFSRLLLSKQEEISMLESSLAGMDKQDKAEDNERYIKSHFEDANRENRPEAWPESRTELLVRLEAKVKEYADLLLKAQQLKSLDQPSRRDYKSVLHFMENDGGPLYTKEAGFIYNREDLVTLRPGRDHAWLDGILERTLKALRSRPIIVVLTSEQETREKSDEEVIHYYDRDRISICVTLILTIMILALLVVPVWILYRLCVAGTIATSPNTLCVIAIFTLLCTAILACFTKAKRHEIVAASAA
ncbi:uncharacterized protein KY384_006302 [Bacidia gigantensis]|uniref:uncharacterized protein n=1 Tax=Bacidia gigantensis TaxID=2732470 RepID=UPI001D044B83|nr:uncharacterized protein KY384_006302 [Bacidia gigantensis]KAG8528615.1 hypothetical protein KY384_006302 [Bacidia gigantensis]